MAKESSSTTTKLRSRITCPHCWHDFPPETVLWISAHPDLRGDVLLGEDEQQRFLPTRYNAEGHALDILDQPCHRLACPRCHLGVPWILLETKPLFVSVLGAPGSGKSYFLASMTWRLRQTLQDQFSLGFGDADPAANQTLTNYEETLFLNPKHDQLVSLPKTEREGDLYESVKFGDGQVFYPRPFVFSIRPHEQHPEYPKRRSTSRALCLYDNAGEHFLPGGETINSSATRHLSLSSALLFLFDPTQHPNIRAECANVSEDPQVGEHGWSHRQDQVLLEAASRIRAHGGDSNSTEKYSKPLIVVATKFDAWAPLLGDDFSLDDIIHPYAENLSVLNKTALQEISDRVRKLFSTFAREIVSAAEGFWSDVLYLPASALGQAPEVDEKTNGLGIRPRDIHPIACELPLLYALHCAAPTLVRSATKKSSPKNSSDAKNSNGDKRSKRKTGGKRKLRVVSPANGDAPPTAAETGNSAQATAATIDSNRPHPDSAGALDLNFLTPSEDPDSLGQLGAYEIHEVLGKGGMGVVLRGLDANLNRPVAIKVLAPWMASDASAKKRFRREARAAAAVSHEHVVAIYAIDEINSSPFIVMAYVEGDTLAERIDREEALELDEILRIGAQAASGLAAAHAQGLVHRDIKPGNILLERNGDRVKVTDFGLARAASDARITRTDTVAGTPEYMSPEQASGEPLDHRSDLFSFGCVLYAMCSGRSPFRSSSMIDAIRRVCDETPPPVRETNPNVPEFLADIIDRLLCKDPDGRFQSAAELSKTLNSHLAKRDAGQNVDDDSTDARRGTGS